MTIHEVEVNSNLSTKPLFSGFLYLTSQRELRHCRAEHWWSLSFKALLPVCILAFIATLITNDQWHGWMMYANLGACLVMISQTEEGSKKWVAFKNLRQYKEL